MTAIMEEEAAHQVLKDHMENIIVEVHPVDTINMVHLHLDITQEVHLLIGGEGPEEDRPKCGEGAGVVMVGDPKRRLVCRFWSETSLTKLLKKNFIRPSQELVTFATSTFREITIRSNPKVLLLSNSLRLKWHRTRVMKWTSLL